MIPRWGRSQVLSRKCQTPLPRFQSAVSTPAARSIFFSRWMFASDMSPPLPHPFLNQTTILLYGPMKSQLCFHWALQEQTVKKSFLSETKEVISISWEALQLLRNIELYGIRSAVKIQYRYNDFLDLSKLSFTVPNRPWGEKDLLVQLVTIYFLSVVLSFQPASHF